MEIRKVIKIGNSRGITLPPSQFGLEEGEYVYVDVKRVPMPGEAPGRIRTVLDQSVGMAVA